MDTSIITTSVSKGRAPWSAPMRGNNRRNIRPGGINPNIPPGGIQRRVDHFRNRPLNTSRPPSMHVDEFEKQYNDNTNGNNGPNSTSTNSNNNNLNENNNGNDNDLLSTIQSSNDGGSDRVKNCDDLILIEKIFLSFRIAGLVEVIHQIFERVHHLVIVIHSHQIISVIKVRKIYSLVLFFIPLFRWRF